MIETPILIGSKIQLFPIRHFSSRRSLKTILVVAVVFSILTAGIREKTESLIYKEYGDSVSILFQKNEIPKSLKSIAEKSSKLRFMNNQIYLWKIMNNDLIKGIVILDNVKGKSQPITFAVFYDAEGQIRSSEIIKYREPIGGEVSNRYWLKQFLGKSWKSNYKVGKKIDGISGATISVNAVTRGIHRSAFLAKYFLELNDE
ncbi:FMN-binding protein [Candidatus Marinimicrobia bacterium]|nr:FMN-binding protein [Candidatus Neomarinimicrobiota bacterium]